MIHVFDRRHPKKRKKHVAIPGVGGMSILPTDIANLQEWVANCIYVKNSGASYQYFWQSELSVAACGSYVYGELNGNNKYLGGIAATSLVPSTESLDGNLIFKSDATTPQGSSSLNQKVYPQTPVLTAAQPELTIFLILKIGTEPGTSVQALRWYGNTVNTQMYLFMAGTGNNYLSWYVKSNNATVNQVIDTTNRQSDGKYYLVVLQYSYTTKIAKLIIDGNTFTNTAAGADTFDYGTSAIFYTGSASGGNWVGSIGEMCIYDIVELTTAQINSLANLYYLKKYPSLTWTDI